MKCLKSDYSCVYHACLSDECQQIPVFENGVSFGMGECQQFDADKDARVIIANNCGNPPVKSKLEYCVWNNTMKLEHYSKNPIGTSSFSAKLIESYKAQIRIANEMIKEIESEPALI